MLLGYNADADAPQAETQSFVATLDDSTSVVRTWWIEDEGGGVQYCDARGSDEACDVNVLVDLAPGANTLIVKTAEGDGEGKEALRLTVVRALRLLCNASARAPPPPPRRRRRGSTRWRRRRSRRWLFARR